MDPAYLQNLHSLLEQSIAPDTNMVKAATAQLNANFYKSPTVIPALASILASSPNDGVRQLTAVELRKRIIGKSGVMWTAVPQGDRNQIKENLPSVILAESSKLVRTAAARVVAGIAAIEFPEGTWPSLLPWLNQQCTSPTAHNREVGVYILFTVLESIVEYQAHLPALFTLLETALEDPESLEVRITTVRALGTIAQYLDRDEKPSLYRFQSILPGMIQVIAQTVEAGNENGARQLFDVLETLLIIEVPVLSKSIPELVQFLIQCGGNRSFDTDLRCLALNALNWTVQYKQSKLNTLGLAPVMLQGLMPITTEEEAEDIDDDTPSRSALRVIDNMCTHLPPTQVFPSIRQLVGQYFSSPDPANRRGAILALGISVEGCSEYITPQLNDLWPIVDAGLQDPDASVRKASCTAVSCLCDWLDEECAARHAVLVPVIMSLIDDPATQKAACTALDGLLEILHDVIDLYLQLIMERLGALLVTAPLPVKAVITGAIGSAAHASKEKFAPYFQPTMNVLEHFLILTGEGEEIELRGITMDAVGTFAEAVGTDTFRPYFADMMKQAFQGIEMGHPRLKECSFLFFGVIARVFGEEFAPYLPNVMPPLLASCGQAEGDDFDVPGAVAAFNAGESANDAITISDDGTIHANAIDLSDVDLDKLSEVNSAMAVEKEIAADTLGIIFAATKTHFLPYVEQSCLELIRLFDHYYEGIRKSAVSSILEIVRAFYDLGNYPEWQPGPTVVHPLNQPTMELISHVLPSLLDLFESEDHKSVVSNLCVGMAETITKIGPAFVINHLDGISKMAVQILDQKAFCQQDPDQDADDEAPEDTAEYEGVLISSAGDLAGALASVLGEGFAPAFPTFYPLIAKYCKKSRSLTDRASAIGCLAEIVTGMKSAVTPHTETLFQLFYNAVTDKEPEVSSNAAFALGVLVEHSQTDLSGQYLTLLGVLRPLFEVNSESSTPKLNAKDNAAGAVARLILKNTVAVPLDQVLPIFLNALPCKDDLMENRSVFRAIFHLFNTNSAALLPYLDGLLQIFRVVLDPSGTDLVTAETRTDLIQLIQALNAQDPAKIQAAGLSVWL